jgi:hypothetical protein
MNNSKEKPTPEPDIEAWKKILPPHIASNLVRIQNYVESTSTEKGQSPLSEEVAALILKTMADIRKLREPEQNQAQTNAETTEQQAITVAAQYLDTIIESNPDLATIILDSTLARHNLPEIIALVKENPENAVILQFWVEHRPSLRNKEKLDELLTEIKHARPDLIDYLRAQVENFDDIFSAAVGRAMLEETRSIPLSDRLALTDEQIRNMIRRIDLGKRYTKDENTEE